MVAGWEGWGALEAYPSEKSGFAGLGLQCTMEQVRQTKADLMKLLGRAAGAIE